MSEERELTEDELRVLKEAEAFMQKALDCLAPWAKPVSRRRQHKPRVAISGGLRTMQQAADKLGCSIKTLKGHLVSGALTYVTIGHGSKRPRRMFAESDLDAFIANQSRKDITCPSTASPARHTGTSTSRCEVIAFTAQPRPQPAVRRKR